MILRTAILLLSFGPLLRCTGEAQSRSALSAQIADSYMRRHPGFVTYDSGSPNKRWNYEQGLILTAMVRMWQHTGDRKYAAFVRGNLDQYVDSTGRISTYQRNDFRLDDIAPGRALLWMYEDTHEPRYRAAAESLLLQLGGQPRTSEGGFWHKKIYPSQMWLDGLYMAEPFSALAAGMLGRPDLLKDVTRQFVLISRHTRDARTGLYYHGWDESRKERWAHPVSGCSASFWGRGMGWFAMALVDVLEYLPRDNPGRAGLVQMLQDLAPALLKYRDPATHLWHQVVDAGGREGNYLESSGSAMIAYAFAKGANDGILDKPWLTRARETLDGLFANLVTFDSGAEAPDLHETCDHIGLGGNPYRDGSFGYYVREPRRTNDPRGIGALLLAAIEVERGPIE